MAFESITGRSKAGRPKGTGHPSELTISGKKGIISATGNRLSMDRLQFRIASSLRVKSGLEARQKVTVMFDKDNMLGKICPSDNGYCLSPSTAPGSDYDLRFFIPYNPDTKFPWYQAQTGMEIIQAADCEIIFRVIPMETEGNAYEVLALNHQGNGEFQQSQKKVGRDEKTGTTGS